MSAVALREGGITNAPSTCMDLDRRKHDVDVIERVLGGIRDTGPDGRTRVVDVDVHSDPDEHSTLELTIGLDNSESSHSDRRRRS